MSFYVRVCLENYSFALRIHQRETWDIKIYFTKIFQFASLIYCFIIIIIILKKQLSSPPKVTALSSLTSFSIS